MFFSKKTITIRLTKEQTKKINRIIKNNDNYDSKSHFIRCAIIKLIKQEE